MGTILHALVCPSVGVVVSGAIFHTSFVYRLSKGPIGAFFYTVPCCIVGKIPIRAFILALFCYIITELLPGTVCHTSQRYTVSKSTIQSQRASCHTFSSHTFCEVVHTCNNLTHLHAQANRSIGGMLEGVIFLWADGHAFPCGIIREQIN